ncbi:hypothetical protein FO519_003055 [Halicephalobus sp. NKZ332]|nr:hypothetical protein FO519_003055 [Halicephalobus sp. NKZ332]
MVEPPPEYSEFARCSSKDIVESDTINDNIIDSSTVSNSAVNCHTVNNTIVNNDTYAIQLLSQAVKRQSIVIFDLEEQLEEQRKVIENWRSGFKTATPPPDYSEAVEHTVSSIGNNIIHDIELFLNTVREQSTVIYNLEQHLEGQKEVIEELNLATNVTFSNVFRHQFGPYEYENIKRVPTAIGHFFKVSSLCWPPPEYTEFTTYTVGNLENSDAHNVQLLWHALRKQSTLIYECRQQLDNQKRQLEALRAEHLEKNDFCQRLGGICLATYFIFWILLLFYLFLAKL